MARLHFVKKARKAIPSAKIKKGDSYYWWQFAYSPRSVSKDRPKRSQLTRSSYLGQMYDLEDEVPAINEFDDIEGAAEYLDNAASEVENLKEEQESNLSNMPDHLQESSPAGETLQTRIDRCEELHQELEDAAQQLRDIDEEDENAVEEAQSVLEGIDWSAE